MYTPEITESIVARYQANPSRDTVNAIAEELGKSPKSVIGKLSREGVYQREGYKTKTGQDPITKPQLVSLIAEKMGMNEDMLEGLEKSPKNVLGLILQWLGQ
jgi:hypothetical protein